LAIKKKRTEINIAEVMKDPIDLEALQTIVDYFGDGFLKLYVKIPKPIEHLASKTIQNYLNLPLSAQLSVYMSYEVKGKLNAKKGSKDGFVFQMAKANIQQIKKYNPEIFHNEKNTPLRTRARTIVRLASIEPQEKRKEKIRELYHSYPYFLLKSEPIKLRLKNFYFDKYLNIGDVLKIYRSDDYENPNPETDSLYSEKEYSPNKTVSFKYEGRNEEYYYAVNQQNGDRSEVLRFVWE
jgi:hypothetical protein